jgi:hypothetical protein
MPKEIHSKGDPHSQIWVTVDEPYQKDAEKGFLFSSGLGYIFDKMMKEAGITDYYVTCRKPDLEDKSSYRIIENDLNHYRPPLIIALGNTASYLCKEVRDANTRKGRRSAKEIAGLLIENEEETPLDKYAGSLLCSNLLTYPHYIIPSYLPDSIMADWSLRDIIVSLDLGKAKSELDYYKQNGLIQPLPDRKLLYDLSFFEILKLLDYFEHSCSLLSVDIETVYCKKNSFFYPHIGYPTCIGIASSRDLGISFPLFRESEYEQIILWRKLDKLFKEKKILGQNFFEFDVSRLNCLGFDIPLSNIVDTRIRHHILWAELPHSLQFMTRQYTRQPFYKEDGKQWSMKDMSGLRRYNCLDVTVTMEVFEQQEIEIKERGIE